MWLSDILHDAMCYVEAGCIGGRLVRGFVVVVVVGSRRQLDTLDQYQCAGSEGQIDAEGGCRRREYLTRPAEGGQKEGRGSRAKWVREGERDGLREWVTRNNGRERKRAWRAKEAKQTQTRVANYDQGSLGW